MAIYHILDYFFLIFHTIFIIFNALGWMWKKTRIYALITLLLTAFSWFGLGIFYGWGYCFITDFHWQVLEKLGITDLPLSYMQFLLQRVTGLTFNSESILNLTGIIYFISLTGCIALAIRDRVKRIKKRR
jgi:hypothetical protein